MKKILRNLDVFEDVLPKKLQLFVETLRSLKNLDEAVSGHLLDPNFPDIIKRFSSNWIRLKKEFHVPITNKVHIIVSHLEDYLNLTNRPLGKCSDQVIERIHQELHQRFTYSNYLMKDLTHPNFLVKFEKGLMHFNAYNVNMLSFDESYAQM